MSGSQLEKVVLRRIHLIDAEIRKGTYPNTKQLAEMLEVGERTISRDIDEMRNFYNAPIEYDRKYNGYYYTEDSFYIEDLSLSEGELLSMALMDKMLGEYRNTPLEAQLRSVFHKIVSSMGNQTMADFFHLQEGVSCVPRTSDTVDAKVFSDVFQALKAHQELSVRYKQDKNDQFIKQSIRPYHVVCSHGDWYVIGQAASKSPVQLFALSQIKDSKVTRRCFDVPKDFDWHNYVPQDDIRWQSDDAIPVDDMAGGRIDYIKGDKALFDQLLDRWLYILWDKSVIRHAKFVSGLGELQLRGDGYCFQFREGDDEEQRYLSKEMIIPASGLAGNHRISYCYLRSDMEDAGTITLLFNRLHNAGRTLLCICSEDCKGKETKAIASIHEDIPLERFLTALGRSDVFKEYETFVMLMKDNVPLIAYKEQKAREHVEKEIMARLQPVLDDLFSSGKLDELGAGYGPDITAFRRLVDKGISRAVKKRV